MITFEDKLQASAQRLAEQDNKRMHVPQNPLSQKRSYWGWIATPAAAVVGIIFGMTLPLFMRSEPTNQLAQSIDTVRVIESVRDTLYLTQVVEKEKVIYKSLPTQQTAESAPRESDYQPGQCTSIQCDGIDYSILATN